MREETGRRVRLKTPRATPPHENARTQVDGLLRSPLEHNPTVRNRGGSPTRLQTALQEPLGSAFPLSGDVGPTALSSQPNRSYRAGERLPTSLVGNILLEHIWNSAWLIPNWDHARVSPCVSLPNGPFAHSGNGTQRRKVPWKRGTRKWLGQTEQLLRMSKLSFGQQACFRETE